ncbi:ImuA family protein [Roseomonas elaeocarpi]|uniref:ImuA family protein n=1 Tax=Roseomonas elaeocarpi TaxID=907779 RepID=A0ABV6JU84_9PROT
MGSASDPAQDRRALLEDLRSRVLVIERGERIASQDRPVVPVSAPIDAALPDGGLALGGVHEILTEDVGAGTGFAAMLLARLSGQVVWISQEEDLGVHGLVQFGLQPEALLLVTPSRPEDGLWAMEEALRCPAIAGAVLVTGPTDMTTARRLQLAAEEGGVLGVLLCERREAAGATAALTRWRVAPQREAPPCRPSWRLELLRSRGGRPGAWDVQWDREARELRH